jgi:hypothetical protein
LIKDPNSETAYETADTMPAYCRDFEKVELITGCFLFKDHCMAARLQQPFVRTGRETLRESESESVSDYAGGPPTFTTPCPQSESDQSEYDRVSRDTPGRCDDHAVCLEAASRERSVSPLGAESSTCAAESECANSAKSQRDRELAPEPQCMTRADTDPADVHRAVTTRADPEPADVHRIVTTREFTSFDVQTGADVNSDVHCGGATRAGSGSTDIHCDGATRAGSVSTDVHDACGDGKSNIGRAGCDLRDGTVEAATCDRDDNLSSAQRSKSHSDCDKSHQYCVRDSGRSHHATGLDRGNLYDLTESAQPGPGPDFVGVPQLRDAVAAGDDRGTFGAAPRKPLAGERQSYATVNHASNDMDPVRERPGHQHSEGTFYDFAIPLSGASTDKPIINHPILAAAPPGGAPSSSPPRDTCLLVVLPSGSPSVAPGLGYKTCMSASGIPKGLMQGTLPGRIWTHPRLPGGPPVR